MTMYEMSEGYAEAIDKINVRLKFLRIDKDANSMEIRHLMMVRKDLAKIEEICRKYYERGYWVDSAFSFNKAPAIHRKGRPIVDGRKSGDKRTGCPKVEKKPDYSNTGGTDREAASNAADVIIGWFVSGGDSGKAGSK